MKKIKPNYNEISKYLVYFLLFLLFCNAKTIGGYKPFGLGLFVGLAYSKQNLLVLAVMYIASSLAFSPTVATAVCTITPCLIISGAYYLHNKFKYPINMTYINIYAFLSSLVAFAFSDINDMLNLAVSVFLGQVFTFCAVIFFYAVLIRGLKYKFNLDEIAAGCVVLAVFSIGLYSVEFLGYNLYFTIAPFIVLLGCYFSNAGSLILSAVMGLGVTLATGEVSYIATSVVWGLTASLFKHIPYIAGVGVILVDIMMGMYFTAYPVYTIINIVAVGVGVLLFILIPKKIRRYITSNFGVVKGGFATKNIVNRSRADVSSKLASISSVFYDMNYILKNNFHEEKTIEEKSNIIATEIVKKCCTNCKKHEECKKALGGDTVEIYSQMVHSVLKRGKTTILDIPPFIASRCGNMDILLKLMAKEIESYKIKCEKETAQNKATYALSEQMKGMSDILLSISDDIKKTIKFDQNTEQQIIDELMYHNVVCTEAIVYTSKEKNEVSLVVRETDVNKKIITKVISKILKKKMIVKMNSIKKVHNACCLELIECPNYDLVFGEANKNRDDNLVSGDTAVVQKISDDKVIIALSDGMGSGESANEKSKTALAMIESFYQAGFNNEVILAMVNKLLAMSGDDEFTTLDMCVVDLLTGRADFIKMGASDGLIKRRENCEVISGSGLPIGILDEVKINVESKALISGDMVIVVSDGVSDVVDNDTLVEIVDTANTINPQSMADIIMKYAVEKGAKDDVSVVTARLFNKVAV